MSADRSTLAVCVDVLGPLTLRVQGRAVEVPGLRRRALLALLALASGRPVGTERLVESLWPDEPPDNAAQALYNHVSRIRGHLGPLGDRLERRGAGYRLHLEPDELDADTARRLAGQAADPAAGAADVAALTEAALALWRGPALEEFGSVPAIEVQSVGLDELRRRLVDDLLEARLTLGAPGVPTEAAAAAAAEPLRERTALLYVRALATDGRPAEAMAVAQGFRRRLAEETGLDPGPALGELEQQVAAGALAAEPRRPGPGRVVPRPEGPLVGREHDREEVLRLLGTHATVTITGPGGVGKTRLALDVAADPEAVPEPGTDVVVVDLAAVDRPDRVCQAVASTLGLRTTAEVGPGEVASALAGRRLLLVLDNCEHLAGACRELVAAVRSRAPDVRVLATSRVTLRAPGEYVVRLQPLAVPRDAVALDSLRRQPGVRAFVEHARRRGADFTLGVDDAADLVEVLRRLDGLPLGIELAARQVAVMPLHAVRERLDRALDLDTGRPGAEDDRQRTLRATIDSSYRWLDEGEQRLLRSIAPFPGGVDLATIEVLTGALGILGDPLDTLHRLVDASLVVADASQGRYRLLFTVRTFLLEQLADLGELDAAETLFLDHCLAVGHELGTALGGPAEAAADRRLRAELDNLRAAHDVASARGRHDVREGITLALDEPATWRDLRELWAWALELAAEPRPDGRPQGPAVLGAAAEAARLTGDLDRAARLADRAFDAAGADPDPPAVARAWSARASVAHFGGDFAAAVEDWLRAAEGRPQRSGPYVASAALAAAYGGQSDLARRLLDQARAADAVTRCGSHAAFTSYVEGELRASARVEESVPYYLSAIEEARRVGASFVEGVARVALASAYTRIGDVPGAAQGFAFLVDFWRRTDQTTQLWTTARNAAGLLASTGHRDTAALLLLTADNQPGSAAVGPEIARFSGRTFTAVTDLAAGPELTALRAEAVALGPSGVLDRAVADLAELGGLAR